MKMVKKILLGLTATALVLGMASCKMGAGEGDTEGNKWDLKMTIDATAEAEKPMDAANAYRRFWKQFSTSEKVAEIKTTITLDESECKLVSGKASVVGYIFDLNKNKDDSSKVDFCLLGINPQFGGFYVERYTGISKSDKEEYDVPESQSSLGTSVDIGYGTYKRADINTWNNLSSSMYTKTDGVITCVVTIKQTSKTYSVYLGSVKVAEYDASASENTWKNKDDVEYAVGGIACYGNAGNGVKIVAKYHTEKDDVTGKLEAEEE